MTFQNIDDFESADRIPEKNHIVPVGDRSNAGQKLRPLPSERTGYACELMAMVADLADELSADRNTIARFCDVDEDRPQIPFYGCEE